MKPEHIEDILDRCLARIAAGEDVNACLRDEPEHADVLAPLLQAAVELRGLELPSLSEVARTAVRTRAHAALTRPRVSWRLALASLRIRRLAVLVMLMVVMVLAGVDAASAQSLPGETLYTWKRAHENISLALTADPKERSELLVAFAGRRLQEFNTLVATGNDADAALIAKTLDDLLENVQGAIATSRQAQTTDVAPALKQILNETKSAITQATAVPPDTLSVLDDARVRADVMDQNIVTADITSTPTDTAVATESNNKGGPACGRNNTATAVPTNAVVSPLTPTPTATSTPSLPTSPAPTLVVGETSAPEPSPTVALENTPIIDPATVLPPTGEPTETSNETLPLPLPPTGVLIDTPPRSTFEPPTDTALPTEEPPTPLPTQPPCNSLTPTDTATPTVTVIATPPMPRPEAPTWTPTLTSGHE